MAVEMTDNAGDVMTKLAQTKLDLLESLGKMAVQLTLMKMRTGYWKNIYLTGALQADVQFEVERSGPDTVDVGNTLHYGKYVHFGTYKMRARPYLADAIAAGQHDFQQTAKAHFKRAFD